MISIDQIATIADLCDFLDSAARIEEASSPPFKTCYKVCLRDYFVRREESGGGTCGVCETNEEFWHIQQVLPRLFDLDAFGWECENISFDRTYAFDSMSVLRYDITLRREV